MLLLTNAQKVTLSVKPVDQYGNVAKVDGVPKWTVSDPNILECAVAADGLSAVVMAMGPLGTAQVNVAADADLGAGVRTISGALDIQVEAGEAVALNIAAGVPEPK